MSRSVATGARTVAAGALVLGTLGLAPGAGAAEAPTCEGRTATIVGTAQADRLYGTPGPDVVWLGGTESGAIDVFVDNGGDDLICQGGRGGASVQAGPGDDVIWLATNWSVSSDHSQVAYGGDGNDTLHAGGAVAGLFGGPGNDVLIGTSEVADELFGGPGDDELTGLGKDDWLDGGDGDDRIDAGGGADRVIGTPGSDQLEGGPGDDELAYSVWNLHDVTQMDAGVAIDVSAGEVVSNSGSTRASGIECWTGTPYADTIQGGPAADCLDGGDGDGRDTIRSRGGDDRVAIYSGRVEGGTGDDTLEAAQSRETTGPNPDFVAEVHAGPGDDEIRLVSQTAHAFGDAGDDVVDFGFSFDATASGGRGSDTLRLDDPADLDARAGTTTFDWSAFTHRLRFDAFEVFVGSPGDDRLRGSSGSEVFRGAGGDDTILGRGGADSLLGKKGDDVLRGGAGKDVADGGPGDDTCSAETETSC